MNGLEITELGQVREQENMLGRAQSQALRRFRREVEPASGWLTRPRWMVRRRLGRQAGSR